MATEMEMPPPPPPRARGRSAWSRCDEAVARIAPTSTTTCQVCSQSIAQGEWQLGVMFIHVEGFMLMEWYHLQCSFCIPGGGLQDVLETVQSEMTSAQKLQFQAAYEKLVTSGGNEGPLAMASATMVS
uniref:PARP-type domain-containing protein n=1 Tax=Globisporangium ultimum (strain ATCC 200006 / CBS 805.95 / DAOM BR144) TaxID=431595 RepID=K3X8D5_GLOUD